ncbi:glycosyl-transferase for dystroglycan-domain-containing protein [Lanmaoa asiatica]|nr:glycosyl-transferase for dystroglycan-domain-containing protein [Lanmaoa asiatica]
MLDSAMARKLVHILVIVYITCAIVYSSYSLLRTAALRITRWFAPNPTSARDGVKLQNFKHALIPSNLPEEMLYWPATPNDEHDLQSGEVAMRESLFLSKAFSQSMQPCKIIPFYYKGSATFEDDDITITTLVTFSRFKVFGELAKRYRGPISAAVHVVPRDSHVVLDALHDLYTSTPGMSSFVDVHLVLSPFARQLNTWRNVARLFARTEFVMMLDVDFAICTDFRSHVRAGLDGEVGRSLRDGYAALVVPAFEYLNQEDGVDPDTFPSDKKVLLELVKTGKIDMFHKSWAPGHSSSDYPRFYVAAPGEVYRIKQYQAAYEPYVIFKKEGPPWCDERFVGYGGNKAACLYEMYLSGMSFFVLADHFLIHQSHVYEEAARRLERKSNRRIYQDFKEEICLRYLQQHRDAGALNTTLGRNVIEECKRLKGVSNSAVYIMDGKV